LGLSFPRVEFMNLDILLSHSFAFSWILQISIHGA
jgi:hypothetical protein